MNAEVIVFDKDGTLIDFDIFWIAVSVAALKDMLKKIGREDIPVDEMLEVMGVENGVCDIDGILCKGKYEEMGIVIHKVLKKYGCDISEEKTIQLVNDTYRDNADAGEVKATCENIRGLMEKLKADGRKLLVITTDKYEITHKCLDKLGITDLFEKICCDDGITPTKPNPEAILNYCKDTGISTDKVMMVGDTMTDVRFARNAGIFVVGVGSDEKKRQRLKPHADAVIPDISYIYDILKEEN